jgi:hypothetical protein
VLEQIEFNWILSLKSREDKSRNLVGGIPMIKNQKNKKEKRNERVGKSKNAS